MSKREKKKNSSLFYQIFSRTQIHLDILLSNLTLLSASDQEEERQLGIVGAKIVMSLIDNKDKKNYKINNKANLIIFRNNILLPNPLKNGLYKQELIIKN